MCVCVHACVCACMCVCVCVCVHVCLCACVCLHVVCPSVACTLLLYICPSSKSNTALLQFSWHASTHQCCLLKVWNSSRSFISTTDRELLEPIAMLPSETKDSQCNFNFSRAVCLYLSHSSVDPIRPRCHQSCDLLNEVPHFDLITGLTRNVQSYPLSDEVRLCSPVLCTLHTLSNMGVLLFGCYFRMWLQCVLDSCVKFTLYLVC